MHHEIGQTNNGQVALHKAPTFPALGSFFSLRKSNKKVKKDKQDALKLSISTHPSQSVGSISILSTVPSSPFHESNSGASCGSGETARTSVASEQAAPQLHDRNTVAKVLKSPNVLFAEQVDVQIYKTAAAIHEEDNRSANPRRESESDRTRKCLEAFSEALRKSKTSQWPTELESPPRADVGSPISEGIILQPENNPRIGKPHRRTKRATSYSGQQDTQHGLCWRQEAQHYSRLRLPDCPPGCDTVFRSCSERVHRKRSPVYYPPRAHLLQQFSARRGSCPDLAFDRSAGGDAGQIDHSIGAHIVLKWLANGRSFIDASIGHILKDSGSKCLAIENQIRHFSIEFPEAAETVYRSPISSVAIPIQARYTQLPYHDETFDVIWARGLSSTVLAEHWPATIRELKRILRPGGKIEITAWGSSWINPDSSKKLISHQARFMKCLANAGFYEELTESLPEVVAGCGFSTVNAAYVAIPIGWGVMITTSP